jgi:hypothetical protein
MPDSAAIMLAAPTPIDRADPERRYDRGYLAGGLAAVMAELT